MFLNCRRIETPSMFLFSPSLAAAAAPRRMAMLDLELTVLDPPELVASARAIASRLRSGGDRISR